MFQPLSVFWKFCSSAGESSNMPFASAELDGMLVWEWTFLSIEDQAVTMKIILDRAKNAKML